MTVNEILKAALALCGESNPFPRNEAFAPAWANILLAESFPVQCSIAEYNGEAVPPNVGEVTELSDKVPAPEEICRGALVYGFAAFICDNCDDRALAAEFRGRFFEALHQAAKINEHAVADYY